MSHRQVGARLAGSAPRSAQLVLGVLLAFAPPLLFQTLGDGVGSYSMFTRPERYRIRVIAIGEGGERRYLPLADFAPHLGRDARRVILSASDWFVGETQMRLLASGLADVGELGCALDPRAVRVDVVLERHSVRHEELGFQVAKVACRESRVAR